MSTIGSSTTIKSPVITQSQLATNNGNSSTFLTSTDSSPVQKIVDAQKVKAVSGFEGSYYYSEDYLRLKAFEIKSRISTYKNMGLTAQYAAAQQEGQLVVGAYQAYAKASAAAGKDEKIAKLAGARAAKEYMLSAQRQSFTVAPTLLTSA